MSRTEDKVAFEFLAKHWLYTEYRKLSGDAFSSLFSGMDTGSTFDCMPSKSRESHCKASPTTFLMIGRECSFETHSSKFSNVSIVASVSCLPSNGRIPALHRSGLRPHKSFIRSLLEDPTTTLSLDELISYLTQQNKPATV